MSNLSIVQIAQWVTKLHNEIIGLAYRSLDQAIEIGELLDAAKSRLEHGDWLPWLKQVPFSERTAQNYIRVFKNKKSLKSATVADLTDAYKLLTTPSSPPPQAKSNTKALADLNEPKPQPKAESPKPKPAEPELGETPKPEQEEPKPKKKKLAQEFQDPNVVKDDTGMVIPDALVPLWNRRNEIDALVVHLREVVKLAKASQESEDPLWAKMPQEIFSNCNLALTFLKGFRLHAVCPTCLGKQPAKCGNCGGVGIVREFFWSSCVSTEQKDMRAKFVASQS